MRTVVGWPPKHQVLATQKSENVGSMSLRTFHLRLMITCMVHTASDRRRVGFIVYPEITALDFVGPMEAFSAATIGEGVDGKRPCYELIVIGVDERPITAESGVVFNVHCALNAAPPLDTVIIPGGGGLRNPQTMQKVAAWILRRARRIRRIVSVCTGIYGLAATGLLDGRHVTTHWAFAEDVSRRFPKLKLNSDALFLRDGKFYTSAGVTAGIDLSLALIEEDFGPRVALSVARTLVVYLQRSGDQAQYSDPLRFQAQSTGRFADLASWVSQNLQRDLSVVQLAERAALGPRHFSRRFKDTFNMTPAAFVELARMNEACRRLTLPRAPIENVASSVGFKSADVFRRAFERRFGLTPTSYRRRFGSSSTPTKESSS
jgi:transcriptional regulator GlxA family with amidase domain